MIVQKSGLRNRLGISPKKLVVVSFLAAFLLGACLLTLPFAHASGQWGRFLDCFFLSTSATCVTGLSPYPDLGKEFSVFGLVVLLLLVQFGALGIMTLGTFLIELMGGRATMKEEQMLMDSLGVHAGGIRSILRRTVAFTAFWEVAGAVILSLRFHFAHEYALPKAIGHGVFHAISGFCNAGLTLYPDSLVRFAADPVVLLTEALLLLIGGIGFIVHTNVISLRPWRRDRLARGRLTLHSRIVLSATFLLVAAGTLFYWLAEHGGAFAGQPFWQTWLDSFFKTVTTRTCGFSATDENAFSGFSKIFSMVLMVIGGAPGSTAGGMKVTTAAVLAATVVSIVRNREECEIGHRTIPMGIVREAIAILVLGSLTLFSVVFLLHCAEIHSAVFFPEHHGSLSLNLMYETVSAGATVGLSFGNTPDLSPWSKAVLMCAMAIGRLGPLSVAMVLGGRRKSIQRRYPVERIVVG